MSEVNKQCQLKLLADLHVHSIASGHAYSTIEEIAKAAAAKGMELIALTDHGPAMPGGPHEYYFGNLRILPHNLYGVEVLQGVEANVINEQGALDLREVYLKRMDIVLAGFHTICIKPLDRARNTDAMVNALRNPYVDIIVHPGNPDFPINSEQVVRAARDEGKALEINNSSFFVRSGSVDACSEIAELIRHYNALVSIGSDAHISHAVGELSHAFSLALTAGIKAEQIINVSAQSVKKFLAGRGKKRFAEGG